MKCASTTIAAEMTVTNEPKFSKAIQSDSSTALTKSTKSPPWVNSDDDTRSITAPASDMSADTPRNDSLLGSNDENSVDDTTDKLFTQDDLEMQVLTTTGSQLSPFAPSKGECGF